MRDLDIWDPFPRKKWNRFFNEFFHDVPMELSDFSRSPLIEVIEEKDTVKVVAELPGVNKGDIKINVTDENISIGAEQSLSSEENKEKEGYYYSERRVQKFFRQLNLPSEVVPSETSAEYKNGVLTVIMKKKELSKGEGPFNVEVK